MTVSLESRWEREESVEIKDRGCRRQKPSWKRGEASRERGGAENGPRRGKSPTFKQYELQGIRHNLPQPNSTGNCINCFTARSTFDALPQRSVVLHGQGICTLQRSILRGHGSQISHSLVTAAELLRTEYIAQKMMAS